MTIKEILRRKKMLIRETAALSLLRIPNRAAGREWLRSRLDHEIALLPRETRLYRGDLVQRLRSELTDLARLSPPQ